MLHIAARITGIYSVHGATVGKMFESSLYYAIYSSETIALQHTYMALLGYYSAVQDGEAMLIDRSPTGKRPLMLSSSPLHLAIFALIIVLDTMLG